MSKSVALSFSGGKDSCFALHQLRERNIHVACLLTTVWMEGLETVAHGETLRQLKNQAKSLMVPIHFVETSFSTYATDFLKNLKQVKETYQITGIAFGDIYLEGHREWGEEIAQKATLDAVYPLWSKQEKALGMLQEFIDLGFKAKVIKIDNTKLPERWIDRKVDDSFLKDIAKKDVCPMGESGEYHTTVYDGPIFKYRTGL